MRVCVKQHSVREARLVPRPLRARSFARVPVTMSAPASLPDGVDDETQPSWVTELGRRQGITQPASHRYWEQGEQQPHGADTVVAWLHEGPQPALRTANVFLETDAKRVYGVLHLGQRVCGHPGLVHGGVTALILDEMFGQARVVIVLCFLLLFGGPRERGAALCPMSLTAAPLPPHRLRSTMSGVLGLDSRHPRRRVHRQPVCGLQGTGAVPELGVRDCRPGVGGGPQGQAGGAGHLLTRGRCHAVRLRILSVHRGRQGLNTAAEGWTHTHAAIVHSLRCICNTAAAQCWWGAMKAVSSRRRRDM